MAQAAAKLDLSENGIVRHALRAAVNAIEANDYKIELPLEIALAKAPIGSHVRGAPNAVGTAALPMRESMSKDTRRSNRF